MEKVKLIVQEQFSGIRTSEEIFAAVFLSANSGGDGGELILEQQVSMLNDIVNQKWLSDYLEESRRNEFLF